MKTASLLSAVLASSAGLVSASSLEYKDGQIVCPKDLPNGAFCAGDSLGTDIIIRCNNGVAQAGRCGNNLVGQPPIGTGSARCWESSANSGVAACEKNCVVYGSSGTYKGDFTLPDCKPWYTASASATATVTASTEDCDTTTTTTAVTTTITSTEDCEPTTTSTIIHPPTNTTATTDDCETTTEIHTQTQQTKPPLSTGGTGYPGTTKTAVPTTIMTASTSRLPVGPTTTSSVVVGGAMGRGMGGDSFGALGLVLGVIGLMF